MPAKCSLCSSGINHGNPEKSCQDKCRSSFHPKCVGLLATCADLSDDSGFGRSGTQCRPIPNNIINLLEMGELITKMDMLQKDMTLVKARQSEVIEFVIFYGTNSKGEVLKTVVGLEHEFMVKKKECSSLKSKVESMKQMSRSNNIKICGVQERQNEVLKKIRHEVIFAVFESEIQTIHRVVPFSDQVKRTPKVLYGSLSIPV
ncbi:hypothetical protein WA026_022689 [Henosepilachna vigintioctopunctata]|uniref:Phorbol-ester/DAG-type domain-containing protein n=1 Tax=Henosepilachna vigintioctopunctata TaxID=420089 RepID=A0AAW1TT11_9CUCU